MARFNVLGAAAVLTAASLIVFAQAPALPQPKQGGGMMTWTVNVGCPTCRTWQAQTEPAFDGERWSFLVDGRTIHVADCCLTFYMD